MRDHIAVDGRHGAEADRFRDPLIRLPALAADDIYVVCPRCQRRAVVVARRDKVGSAMFWPRRLVCPRCAYAADWDATREPTVWGAPTDPFFRLPLWLTADCCGGHTLWAFNSRHLDLLANYVGARLRERGPVPGTMSMLERLPAWLTAAHHRDEVLRVIGRLRMTLDDTGTRR
jgi:hypothetical protein